MRTGRVSLAGVGRRRHRPVRGGTVLNGLAHETFAGRWTGHRPGRRMRLTAFPRSSRTTSCRGHTDDERHRRLGNRSPKPDTGSSRSSSGHRAWTLGKTQLPEFGFQCRRGSAHRRGAQPMDTDYTAGASSLRDFAFVASPTNDRWSDPHPPCNGLVGLKPSRSQLPLKDDDPQDTDPVDQRRRPDQSVATPLPSTGRAERIWRNRSLLRRSEGHRPRLPASAASPW